MPDDSPFNGDGAPVADLKRARRRAPSALAVDCLPPHAPEAEQGVLGCILTLPNESVGHCLTALKSGAETFYDVRHQTIYAALLEMHGAGKAVDMITVHQWLKDRSQLDQIGGISYLNQLADIPSAANISYWTGIIREKHQLRRVLATCAALAGEVYEFAGDVDEFLDRAERDMMQIRERQGGARAEIGALVDSALSIIEDKFSRQGAISGLSTGFIDLDRYTDGLVAGELIVPAAFPGIGKTSLLMNMTEHVVLVQNLPAAVFSLEMTAEQLVTRFLCSNARVNLKRIGDGGMAEADFPKLAAAAGRTRKAKLYIVDNLETVAQIRAESRRLKQEFNVALISVDYIQRVRAEVTKGANREQEVSAVSRGLKSLATELKVPVVAPSQLNEDGKLRESRAIGQDADNVWVMDSADDGDSVKLWIRKNRNGPRDVSVDLTFLKEFTRFESAAKVSDEDMPPNRNQHAND